MPDTGRPHDRVITSVAERRSTLLSVIRHARKRIMLSLFRCNDADVVAELGRAVDRGVDVEVLLTSRAKGDKKKLRKMWSAIEATGAYWLGRTWEGAIRQRPQSDAEPCR